MRIADRNVIHVLRPLEDEEEPSEVPCGEETECLFDYDENGKTILHDFCFYCGALIEGSGPPLPDDSGDIEGHMESLIFRSYTLNAA